MGLFNNALGFISGGLAGNENYGFIDNIAGGVSDYFMADTNAAKELQKGSRAAQAAVASGYDQAKDLYSGLYYDTKGDIGDYRDAVRGGEFDLDPRLSEYQSFDRTAGPEINKFQSGYTPVFDQFQREQGPQLNQFQRQAGPQLNQFQRQQGPGYQGYSLGPGPEFTGAERGDFNFDLEMDPGYQFKKDEMLGALEGIGAARGNRLSGAAIKEATSRIGDLASEEFGRAYGRQRGEFESDRGLGEREAGRQTAFDMGGFQFGGSMGAQESARRNQAMQSQYQFGTGTDQSAQQNYQSMLQNQAQFGQGMDQSSFQNFQNMQQNQYQFGTGVDQSAKQDFRNFRQGQYQFDTGMDFNADQAYQTQLQNQSQYGNTMDFNINQANNQGRLNTNLQNYNMQSQAVNNRAGLMGGLANQAYGNVNTMSNLFTGEGEALSNAAIGVANANANRAGATRNAVNSGINSLAQVGSVVAPFVASDRRLKRNITKIGMFKEYGKYMYQYLNSDKWFIGGMADDIKKIKPEAIKSFGGFDHVNYGIL